MSQARVKEPDLKACPSCGADAEEIHGAKGSDRFGLWKICCAASNTDHYGEYDRGCPLEPETVWCATRAEAASLWNDRGQYAPSIPTGPELRERVARHLFDTAESNHGPWEQCKQMYLCRAGSILSLLPATPLDPDTKIPRKIIGSFEATFEKGGKRKPVAEVEEDVSAKRGPSALEEARKLAAEIAERFMNADDAYGQGAHSAAFQILCKLEALEAESPRHGEASEPSPSSPLPSPSLETAEGIIWDAITELHRLKDESTEDQNYDVIKAAAEKVLALRPIPQGSEAPAPGARVFRSLDEIAKEYFPKSRLEIRLVDIEEGPSHG